jgi:hypothetical protein
VLGKFLNDHGGGKRTPPRGDDDNKAPRLPIRDIRLSSVYSYPERATSHRRDGFMECCKNSGFADRRRDLVSVQVGPKVWTDTREDDADPFVSQMIE